jgi:hypothetical protein
VFLFILLPFIGEEKPDKIRSDVGYISFIKYLELKQKVTIVNGIPHPTFANANATLSHKWEKEQHW